MNTASIETTHSDPSQADHILAFMKKYPEGITCREAEDFFDCHRLAARIHELKVKRGISVIRTMEGKGRNKYARYRLAQSLTAN